jgi:hypothetical protein
MTLPLKLAERYASCLSSIRRQSCGLGDNRMITKPAMTLFGTKIRSLSVPAKMV